MGSSPHRHSRPVRTPQAVPSPVARPAKSQMTFFSCPAAWGPHMACILHTGMLGKGDQTRVLGAEGRRGHPHSEAWMTVEAASDPGSSAVALELVAVAASATHRVGSLLEATS